MKIKTRVEQRQARTRKKARQVSLRPRLSVFRSNQHIYAQIIDDTKKITLVGVFEKDKTGTKVERAKKLGLELAAAAISKKITTVAFDKGSYRYHGRVKALAEGAREGGLQF